MRKRSIAALGSASAIFACLTASCVTSFRIPPALTSIIPVFGRRDADPDSAANPVLSRPPGFAAVNSIDMGGYYLEGFIDRAPVIMTRVNPDGSISVCSVDPFKRKTFVYEYSKDLEYLRTLTFANVFDRLGAFTKDDEGNFYVFTAKPVEEYQHKADNMALAKYSPSGERLNVYKLKAYPEKSFYGVKEPFAAGSCRLEVSGNMVCAYFGRRMFRAKDDGLNHQASYGFILDKDDFTRIDKGAGTNSSGGFMLMPYASPSFNQLLLPIDGGFVFADQGDAYPRGFMFSRFLRDEKTKCVAAFEFKKGSVYQYTFAQLGGIVKTKTGYLFAGTYERNSKTRDQIHNDSRNLFVMTVKDDFSRCGDPIWITDYSDKARENAAQPKIADMGGGRYLLMWELIGPIGFDGTYMAVIDENGAILEEPAWVSDARLNVNDPLRYDALAGRAYWAVNAGLYAFDPERALDEE